MIVKSNFRFLDDQLISRKKIINLVKSHELICHLIRLYLFPLPPYLKVNEVIFTFNKQDCKDTWYYVEGVPLKFQVCVKIEEYIQLPGEPPIGTTIRCKEELRFLTLSEDPVREQICTRMITAQNG